MSVTAIDAIRQAAILSQQIEVQLLPHIELLQQILFEMLQLLLSSDCQCHYAITRPVLPLILIAPKGYEQFKQSVLSLQPQLDVREKIESANTKLSESIIGTTLDITARETFTLALTSFIQVIKTAEVKP